METSPLIYMVAGEASGDTRAAELGEELRKRFPGARFKGAGGRAMQKRLSPEIFDWADEAVVGIWDVLKKYGYFKAQLDRMRAEIEALRPDLLILVDYPGFNLRLAKAAHDTVPGLKIAHYVSPQVWAWNRGRIPKMARFLDLMLCLFPFEVPLYEESGLRAVCTGHPLLDTLDANRIPGTTRNGDLVALLPGSRVREIRNIFPVMLAAAEDLGDRMPSLRFEVAAATPTLAETITAHTSKSPLQGRITVTTGTAHTLMQTAAAGMVSSGTATLESVFFGLPMAILYKVTWLNWIIGKLVVKVRFLGMPNILAGREIAREFLQNRCRSDLVANELQRLLTDRTACAEQQTAYREVVGKMGERGAAQRAAAAIAAHLLPAEPNISCDNERTGLMQ
jgi:lipid-A-disaccharide synthase